ncbi:AraC family transcriptional regulator [Parafrankia colletiae]|uniref:AraC family transcriptional regulator n=1 Tax=Parafrankia colletiae TaxID=573497 RepID=A0A1S1QGH9_9ACTN|nr:helix-turn-helix domain-containing protein [Parafrankia colletiae]MCK9902592.1 helix-turn-helix domain-containing protein [Frankia sp. Cpl3]OHV31384.1 AraC family transcriptional regulator [Parafrankia colletiae]
MLVLDTALLPPSERADAYLTTAVGASGSCVVHHEPGPDGTWWKRMEIWRFGPLTMVAVKGSGTCLRRTAEHLRADALQTVSVITQSAGIGSFAWNGQQQRVPPRGLVLANKTAGYEYGWNGSGQSVAFMVDAQHFGLPDATVRAAIPLVHTSRIMPLLLGQIRALHRDADELSAAPGASDIGESLVALTRALVVSIAADRRTRRTIAEETLLVRVLAYSRAHLKDPDLTPARIAHAHGISLRTLYRLCEDGGLSLEQWVIRRRLEGTRDDLIAPEHAHRTIEAIARSWGFGSPAYFARRFRQAYGLAPSRWRHAGSAAGHVPRPSGPPARGSHPSDGADN